MTGTLAVRSPSLPRKQQIVDAAVELMHDAGFAGTSVRDIGAAVGLLSGSLYHYFREKEDILYEIQVRLNELIAAIQPRVEAAQVGPLDRLRLLIRLHLEMIEENIALCHVGYTEYRYLKPQQVAEIEPPQRAYHEFLVRLVVEAQQAKVVRSDVDARTAAGAILGLLNSIIWWRHPGSRPASDRLARDYQRILLDGLSDRQAG